MASEKTYKKRTAMACLLPACMALHLTGCGGHETAPMSITAEEKQAYEAEQARIYEAMSQSPPSESP